MARGAAWMVSMRLVIRAAGLINMMIMARLLVPEDFGLVAMAMIFVGGIEALSEFNFDVALIKNQKASRKHYDTAWTLSIIRGACMACLLLVIAAPAAALFEEPRLAPIISVLAVSSLLLGLQNIGVVDFRKSFDFRKDFLFMASDKLVSVAVTIVLAMLWRDYWALIGGIIGGKLWRLLASFAMHPFRPRLSLMAWRELFAFTKWLLLHNILLFFRNRIDRVIIGKMLGPATLGLYTIAHELANLVTSELMAPIRRALLPGYAKLAADGVPMRRMFLDIFGLTLWIGGPIAIGMGLVAEPLVGLIFGSSWKASVPIMQMLVIAGFVALLSSGSHPVYLALGRPELPTLIGGLSALVLFPAVIVAVQIGGVVGAAIAVVLVQTTVALIDISLILVLLKLKMSALVAACWRSLLALSVMSIAVAWIVQNFPVRNSLLSDAVLLSSAIVTGGIVYLFCSFFLWRFFGNEKAPERVVWKAVLQTLSFLRAKLA